MALEFFFLFGRLNLSSLPEDNKKEMIKKTEITITEAGMLFKYEKANEGYWDRPKLYQQVVNKTWLISEALYQVYSFLLLFGNATSYSVYAKDTLHMT